TARPLFRSSIPQNLSLPCRCYCPPNVVPSEDLSELPPTQKHTVSVTLTDRSLRCLDQPAICGAILMGSSRLRVSSACTQRENGMWTERSSIFLLTSRMIPVDGVVASANYRRRSSLGNATVANNRNRRTGRCGGQRLGVSRSTVKRWRPNRHSANH